MIKRSCWKYPYNLDAFASFKKKKTLMRNVTLTSKFLNKSYRCYKGRVIGKLLIAKQHLNHKFGEFFFN